jgi:hypothetical protein
MKVRWMEKQQNVKVVPIRQGILALHEVQEVANRETHRLQSGFRGGSPEKALFISVRQWRRTMVSGLVFGPDEALFRCGVTVPIIAGPDLKLYRCTKDVRWFALSPIIGWVVFPAEIGGWQKRRRASGIVIFDMREVPLKMGFNTGIPGAPKSAAGALGLPALEVRPAGQRNRKSAKVVCVTCNLKGCVGRCHFQTVEGPRVLKSA